MDLPRRDIGDPRALRALAHPLRQRILRRLAQEGPATSAMLARELGEDRGATSFHLRQLGAWHFIEVDEERSNGRLKYWRHVAQDMRFTPEPDDPAADATTAVVTQMLTESLGDLSRFYAEGDPWLHAAELSNSALRLSEDELRAFSRGVPGAAHALRAAARGRARGRAPRDRPVRGLPERAGVIASATTPLPEPRLRSILAAGLPGFLREGFVPLLAFYAALRLAGLGAGIAAALAAAGLIYAWERRHGREGLLLRLSLAFVVVQAGIGLVSHSTTAFLAAPVLANAVWGIAFLASAAIGRPLSGALATAWYPFPPAYRRTPAFVRVFSIESIVWGVYLLARSGLRLAYLQGGSTGGYVVVAFATGAPLTLALVVWSAWFAMRRLDADGG